MLYNNTIKSVTNQDWRAITSLNIGANPLEIFANVQLSRSLKFLFCKDTPQLSNITIDDTAFIALNSLPAWNQNPNDLVGFAIDSDIKTDPIKCAELGGVIRQLFQGKTTYTVTACVLGSSTATLSTATTTPTPNNATVVNSTDSNSSSNTGIIVSVIVGAIGLIGIAIVIFIFIRQEKRLPNQSALEAPYQPYDEPNVQPKVAYNQPEYNTGHTQGTGRSLGTGNSQGSRGHLSAHLDANVANLDLSYLLHHRLVLADLIVTSNKPLASGAYGEVWLGSYGALQVAIKRLKSRQPHQVQKFIDEIILMSQLDSDYIVKFVGASWTRPIEIECVVEYMDLGDLRNYLANQSPRQFTWDQKYQCIVNIVRGLVYLHTYNPPVIHRDLKSRNVLLDSAKGTKLTDFGTSRVAEDNDLMTNGIGTYQWMAPEVISGTSYSSPADIYSFGIILSEFCTHQVPYAGGRNPQTGRLLSQHQVLCEVREGRLHPSFDGEHVPTWAIDVAMHCLQLNEYDRPTALELSAIFNRIKP
ncbi:kinase [Thraustotheca clavata]|uniref:Kinase n=1 Tax=Thraustotheca clavata TaxID=74557 RepID=A0A1V9YIX8_9STRA|nr:kinase [Thraustotheca clavata]